MSISYSFIDNQTYGTDDVNDIVRNLTGSGIAPFPTKTTYDPSDLNLLTSMLVDTGTSLDGCKCSVEGNTVTVSQGIIYFENGVCLTIDSDGYSVTIPSGSAGYIFAHFDDAIQVADITFSESLPQNGYMVLLAQVNAKGTLTDKRTYAKSKIASLGRNEAVTRSFTEYTNTPVVFDDNVSGYALFTVDDIDLSKFNYAIVLVETQNSFGVSSFGIIDLSTGKFLNRACRWYYDTSSGTPPGYTLDNVYSGSDMEWYWRILGTNLCLVSTAIISPKYYNLTSTIIFV